MPTPRPLPWIIAAVAAGAILWLILGQRDADPPAPAPHAEHGDPTPQPPAAPDPGAHPAAAHHDHAAHGVEPTEPAADPATEDLVDPETMSMLPEPPGEDDIDERPAQEPLTPEEQRERTERALALIDRSIERLEAERKAAEASGDTRTAERNRIRVERLRLRRATLTQSPAGAAP